VRVNGSGDGATGAGVARGAIESSVTICLGGMLAGPRIPIGTGGRCGAATAVAGRTGAAMGDRAAVGTGSRAVAARGPRSGSQGGIACQSEGKSCRNRCESGEISWAHDFVLVARYREWRPFARAASRVDMVVRQVRCRRSRIVRRLAYITPAPRPAP